MSLRSRWTSHEGLDKAKKVLLALMEGDDLSSLEIGQHDGRIDLRGFLVPEAVEVASQPMPVTSGTVSTFVGLMELSGSHLQGVDLTGAAMKRLTLVNVDIEDCLFDRADCEGLRVFGSTLADCSFDRANLADGLLGTNRNGRRTHYDKVRFVEARLHSSWATEAHFTRCDFSNARFKNTDFKGSQFTDCLFAGNVEDVLFYGTPPAMAMEHGHDGSVNEMRGVDMRQASFRFVGFRNLDLAQALLPRDPEHLILQPYGRLLPKVVEILEANEAPPAKRCAFMLREGPLKWHLPGQEVGLIALRDFDDAERQILLSAIATVTATA